jgi:uncharacterized protein YecT (DUF1311 family)
MKNVIFACVAALAFAAAPAHAAGRNCDNATTQLDLDDCAAADYQAADGELNRVYVRLMSQYDERNKASLRESERDWIKYRDSTCEHETAESVGGTMHPMLVDECLTEKTKDRVRELRKQLHCEEGDLSCNPPDGGTKGGD